MPRGDGTGPWGAGPMTGRAMGQCAGYDTPGFATAPGWGGGRRGMGGGRGAGWPGGRGYRNRYYATGLTGWQRAERGMQAWGPGGYPQAGPAASGQTAAPASGAADDLRARADRLEQELAEVRDALTRLESEDRPAE